MPPFVPGVVLGSRYELQRLVEDDGVTEAWIAQDRVLARPVIVEALPSAAETLTRDAFVAAVAAAGRLVHAGAAATYDSGELEGSPYVVTERPAGTSLADVVERQGPLTPERAVGIGRQVARALETAHRMGVVHGGVALTTVFVGEDDRTKLGRFAGSGARARLRFGGTGSLAGDVQDLAATLRAATAGQAIPKPLDRVLAAAQPGGTITTAAALLEALEGIDINSDAITAPPGARTSAVASAPPALPVASRGTMVAGIAVALVLVVGIAITGALLVGGGGGSNQGGTGTSGSGGSLTLVAAQAFNPLGNPPTPENGQLASHVSDGDAATVWSTSEYRTRRFGNLKTGTGVYVTLSGSHTLHQLAIVSPSRGWIFSVYVADQPGSDLAAWGRPIGSPTTVTADVTQVDLSGATGSAVLVWITDLGQPAAHFSFGPYRADIGELTVR